MAFVDEASRKEARAFVNMLLCSDAAESYHRGAHITHQRARGVKLPFLLATALLDFQDWPREDAAETLFFDAEEAGLGLAVRPRAGRVVVSEQDVVHRIVPPRGERRRRRKGGGKESPPPPPPPPRYSLVLKLALIPRVVEGEKKDPSPPAPATSVVLPAWRPGALRLGTAAGPRWPLPLA